MISVEKCLLWGTQLSSGPKGKYFLPREGGCGGEKRGFSLDPGAGSTGGGKYRDLEATWEVEWLCLKEQVSSDGATS